MNHKIEELKKEISQLELKEPLTKLVRENFQTNISKYLISLQNPETYNIKDELIKSSTILNSIDTETSQTKQKEIYLDLGRVHACSLFINDLTTQQFDIPDIKLISEILFNQPEFRNQQVYIINQSGEKTDFIEFGQIESVLLVILKWLQKTQMEEKNQIKFISKFHHRFLSLHPFQDGNGRIGRLLLNILLMRFGYLPIIVNTDKRDDYFVSLEMADKGNLEPLYNLTVELELQALEDFTTSVEYITIKQKFQFEEQLKKLNGNFSSFVLTEDEKIDKLLETVFLSSGFIIEETNFISFEGCSKIDSVNLFSIFVKEKFPTINIIVHRDKDYLTQDEIEKQKEMLEKIGVDFFITEGTDIESYFVNADHIHLCHPTISIDQAKQLIIDSLVENKEKSIEFLRKKEFGNQYKKSTHLDQAIIAIIESDLKRFSHGKTLLKIVKRRIQEITSNNADLFKKSDFLKSDFLSAISDKIKKKTA